MGSLQKINQEISYLEDRLYITLTFNGIKHKYPNFINDPNINIELSKLKFKRRRLLKLNNILND